MKKRTSNNGRSDHPPTNNLQRQSSHRSLYNNYFDEDTPNGFLSERSDRGSVSSVHSKFSTGKSHVDGALETSRSYHNGNDLFQTLELKNFVLGDLFDLNKVHNVYNDFENRLLRESKICRAHTAGRSVESIRRSPKAPFEFNFNIAFKNLTIVSDAIVLGGRMDASDLGLLKRNGVTHILNVAQQLPFYFENNFVCLKAPIIDSPHFNITEYQRACSLFLSHIENIGGRVLVHCISGISRSVSIVAMHFISVHKFQLKEIYGYLKSCRSGICPNDGFKYQMVMLEVNEIGYSSVADQFDKDWDFYQLNAVRQSLPLNKRKGRRQGQQGGGDSNSSVSNGATRRSYGSGKNSRYVVPSPSVEDSSAHGSWKISMMSSGQQQERHAQ